MNRIDTDFIRQLEATFAGGADPEWMPRQGGGFHPSSQVAPLVNEEDHDDSFLLLPTISPDAATAQARARVAHIFAAYGELHAILDHFEDRVRKRWAKKKNEPRRLVLLEAWPRMAREHRPDLKAFRREIRRQKLVQGGEAGDVYLWPSINQDDLLAGNTLLRLLNARGRRPPRTFAHLDLENARYSAPGPRIDEPDSMYEMDMSGDTVDTYGVLRQFSPGSVADVLERDRYDVGAGLKTLEIQERLLEFLVSVCKIILNDTDLTDPSLPSVPEPAPLAAPKAEWPSAAALTKSAPYGVPPAVDLLGIKSLVATRVAEAQDHLWSLREDPAYYEDFMREWSEHSSEQVPDEGKKTHPDLATASGRRRYWDRMVAVALWQSHETAFLWRVMADQVAQIAQFQALDRKNLLTTPQHKQDYHDAIRKLKLILESRLVPTLRNRLNVVFPASAPMRSLFKRVPDDEGYTGFAIYPRRALDLKDDLVWLWTEFCDDESEVSMEELAVEFDRLLTSPAPAEKNRISAVVASVFSDIGLVGALQTQLRAAFPRIFEKPGEASHAPVDKRKFDDWAAERVYPVLELMMITGVGGLASGHDLKLGDDGSPAGGKFSCPGAGSEKLTRQRVEALRAAERHLDALWAKFDAHIAKALTEPACRGLKDLLPKGRELARTPEWDDAEKPADKAAKDAATPAPAPEQPAEEPPRVGVEALIGTGYVYRRAGNGASKTGPPSSTKDKAKTASQQASADTKFTVKPRAHRVFATLFHTPSQQQHSPAGEIAWPDFLHAMASIGLVPERLYGSVWQFRSGNGNSSSDGPGGVAFDHAITFHEPHPSGKMAFRVARRYGRRLTRSYGLGLEAVALE